MAEKKRTKSAPRRPASGVSRGFRFLKMNEREGKPRTQGITEIRGPYYSVMGRR